MIPPIASAIETGLPEKAVRQQRLPVMISVGDLDDRLEADWRSVRVTCLREGQS